MLALDLDGTMWEGAVGEDGRDGIRIREGFVREIRALGARGILLAVLSKNDPGDVAWFFEGEDPFVAKAIGWAPKGEGLGRMARDLNLGNDAFVFVDDNPGERAEMRAAHPEVLVADFPPQLGAFFPAHAVTDEDRTKTDQYRAEARRREFASGLSFEDYLKGLGIRTEIHPIAADEIPRVAQLSRKANQFNVRTNRYSEDDVRRFAADPSRLVLTLHASDRFGDQGLVAFVQAERKGDGAEIVDWVMSCRAMNRRLEFALEAELERQLAEQGCRRLEATYVPTAKNAPVRELYEGFGFALAGETAGTKRYARIIGAGTC